MLACVHFILPKSIILIIKIKQIICVFLECIPPHPRILLCTVCCFKDTHKKINKDYSRLSAKFAYRYSDKVIYSFLSVFLSCSFMEKVCHSHFTTPLGYMYGYMHVFFCYFVCIFCSILFDQVVGVAGVTGSIIISMIVIQRCELFLKCKLNICISMKAILHK